MMRLQDIIRVIQNNFYSALVMIIIIFFLTTAFYLLTYKKYLKGKKKPNIKNTAIYLALIGYLFIVLGLTFLNRSGGMARILNFRFLSSYQEAWYSLDSSGWKFIILNILMTLPLGMMLPLLNKRFRILKWTMLVSFLMTLFIEMGQFITGRGSFVLDDIFNNLLGALIGYGLVMAMINLIENNKKEKFKKSLMYLTPMLVVILIFSAVKGVYNLKEFGNLPISYNHHLKMGNVKITLNTGLDNQDLYLNDIKYKSTNVPIYKAELYNEKSAKEFFINFLQNEIQEESVIVDAYEDMAILWVEGDPSYSMSFNYRGGSYDYNEDSLSNQEVKKLNGDQFVLESTLAKMKLKVPKSATFSELDDGSFMWLVDNIVDENSISNGYLHANYYSDDKIKNLSNHVVEYKKVKDVSVKSKTEVYNKLKKGKFQYHNVEKIDTLEVNDINLSYMLDSKGYYQPVYIFKSKINGDNGDLIIPAL